MSFPTIYSFSPTFVIRDVLQCAAVCLAVCCSVLQCVAVRCSVLQCVAVCCSVLQCVAVSFTCVMRDSLCVVRDV